MVRVDKYSMFFKVSAENFGKLLFQVRKFNQSLKTWKLVIKRNIRTVENDKDFYVVENEDPNISGSMDCIRYPISILSEFKEYLENEINEPYEIHNHRVIKGRKIDIEIKEHIKPRDYQKPYIDKIVNSKTHSVLIDLRTGMGKTIIALISLSKLKKAFSIVVLPRYMEKWKSDILENTNIKEDEIAMISGTQTLINALESPKKVLEKYKVFIISLKTLTLFIKAYLNHELGHKTDKTPEDIFKILGTEIVLNDESHQEFHNIFKLMLFSNIRLLVGLTATLEHNDRRLNKMYKLLFPDEARLSRDIEYNKYIRATSMKFYFKDKHKINHKTHIGYSQVKYEKSILKRSSIKKNYFLMLKRIIDEYYIKKRHEGDKCLVFMGTVKMCSEFRDYLKKFYPNLKINKYTQEDPYEVLQVSDISISTILSSGTAIDIKNLVTVIQTVNVDSVQANKQTIGRLREIKDKEVDFIYIWSGDIPSHKAYDTRRTKYFSGISKSITHKLYKEKI